jgi:hypothetical protein
MDETVLNRIVQLTKSNPPFPWISNRDLRHVLRYASILSPNAVASNVCPSGIPSALDPYRPFDRGMHAVFSRSDRNLPACLNEIASIIAFMRDDLRERFDAIRKTAIVSRKELNQGLNLAIFNTKRILLNEDEIEAVGNSNRCRKLCQALQGPYAR